MRGKSILILRSGIVAIERDELIRLSPGDWLSEGGMLNGTEATGSIIALTPLVAYEIADDTIASRLKERPAIADEVSVILSRRLSDEKRCFAPQDAMKPSISLAAKIRQIFDIENF